MKLGLNLYSVAEHGLIEGMPRAWRNVARPPTSDQWLFSRWERLNDPCLARDACVDAIRFRSGPPPMVALLRMRGLYELLREETHALTPPNAQD